jgi:hypothetical protein
MFTVAPLSAGAAPKPKPTTGTATLTATATVIDSVLNTTIGTGTFTGTVTNLKAVFDAASKTTTITGRIAGTVTDSTTGAILATINTTFRTVLTGASGSCQILLLDLGPIFLDLLGLQVDLSRVVLEITAQAGPGNLLGNLLCAVAGLLDGGGTLDRILRPLTDLLNQIFRSL